MKSYEQKLAANKVKSIDYDINEGSDDWFTATHGDSGGGLVCEIDGITYLLGAHLGSSASKTNQDSILLFSHSED